MGSATAVPADIGSLVDRAFEVFDDYRRERYRHGMDREDWECVEREAMEAVVVELHGQNTEGDS